MRAQSLALVAAIAALVPAAALAQPNAAANRNADNDLRMRQAQENLRQYNNQALPATQAEQRLEDLDQRVRTQQNLEAINVPPGPRYNPVVPATALPAGGIDLSAQSALMAKELAAENERLKAYNKP
jgi:hypothetical protein